LTSKCHKAKLFPDIFTPGQYSFSKFVKNNRSLGEILSSHQLLSSTDKPGWKNSERKRQKISSHGLPLERRKEIVRRIFKIVLIYIDLFLLGRGGGGGGGGGEGLGNFQNEILAQLRQLKKHCATGKENPASAFYYPGPVLIGIRAGRQGTPPPQKKLGVTQIFWGQKMYASFRRVRGLCTKMTYSIYFQSFLRWYISFSNSLIIHQVNYKSLHVYHITCLC